jgi:ferrous iron transport protein B
VLTNRILGLPIFAVIMYVMFACTFSENFLFIPELPSPGVWLAGLAETGWGFLTDTLAGIIENSGASEWAYSLVIDGIMEGIGAIVGFLPLVLVLFLLMSVLEDCGYMARVAFVMDRIFRKFGLSGRSFIPLLMGFGCSVPACMATRTLESEKDRKITVMILPWFSCGAKLPIYLMFVATMFADNPTPVIFSIYFMGMAVGVFGALFLNKVMFKSGESNFIMELPPYRLPTLRSVGIHSWEKIKGFAIKAGTIIFGATIHIWLLSNFNFGGMADMEESFLASIGRAVKWLFYPLGFGTDWRPAVGILTGWIAKENIVTTFAQLYSNITDEAVLEALQAGEEALPALSQVFSKVTAYAYMAFNLFCMPCFAAVGAIKRELVTVKWTLRAVGFQMAAAYIVALLINIAGSLITGAAIFK